MLTFNLADEALKSKDYSTARSHVGSIVSIIEKALGNAGEITKAMPERLKEEFDTRYLSFWGHNDNK